MIDVTLTKENALPADLWGCSTRTGADSRGSATIFLQGPENLHDNNPRRRIYMSAVTPDLCRPMYGDKIVGFLDQLMDPRFAGKPFMRHYLDYYFDIYWDLHLGVKDDAIPPMVWTIGESFNTVLAFRDPMRIIDEVKARRIGFPRCPFDLTTFDVSDARKAGPADSGFGTVLGVVDGKPLPISGRSGARRPERR